MKHKIFLLLIFSNLVLFGQSDWKLKKNENGICVYTRKPANSNFVEFKASTTVNAPSDIILKLILNSDKDYEWVDRIAYSKKLSKKGNIHYSYEQTELPIGFRNRDIVLENTLIRKKDGSYLLKIKSVPDKYPRQKGFVRIKDAYGYWLIKPIGANKTFVTYQFFSDPGGVFPSWLVNMFVVDGPYNALSNLKKIMEK